MCNLLKLDIVKVDIDLIVYAQIEFDTSVRVSRLRHCKLEAVSLKLGSYVNNGLQMPSL